MLLPIALVVAVFVGYLLANPLDFATFVGIPLALFVGGIASAFIIALANLRPCPSPPLHPGRPKRTKLHGYRKHRSVGREDRPIMEGCGLLQRAGFNVCAGRNPPNGSWRDGGLVSDPARFMWVRHTGSPRRRGRFGGLRNSRKKACCHHAGRNQLLLKDAAAGPSHRHGYSPAQRQVHAAAKKANYYQLVFETTAREFLSVLG